MASPPIVKQRWLLSIINRLVLIINMSLKSINMCLLLIVITVVCIGLSHTDWKFVQITKHQTQNHGLQKGVAVVLPQGHRTSICRTPNVGRLYVYIGNHIRQLFQFIISTFSVKLCFITWNMLSFFFHQPENHQHSVSNSAITEDWNFEVVLKARFPTIWPRSS